METYKGKLTGLPEDYIWDEGEDGICNDSYIFTWSLRKKCVTSGKAEMQEKQIR